MRVLGMGQLGHSGKGKGKGLLCCVPGGLMRACTAAFATLPLTVRL
jgi:hypothetical protein